MTQASQARPKHGPMAESQRGVDELRRPQRSGLLVRKAHSALSTSRDQILRSLELLPESTVKIRAATVVHLAPQLRTISRVSCHRGLNFRTKVPAQSKMADRIGGRAAGAQIPQDPPGHSPSDSSTIGLDLDLARLLPPRLRPPPCLSRPPRRATTSGP